MRSMTIELKGAKLRDTYQERRALSEMSLELRFSLSERRAGREQGISSQS